jgi:S1-C subfamily serine protease
MALVIKYTSGTEAGRELKIDDGDSEIKFGRDSDAEVPFPIDLTIVSRDHFRLRREAGGYKFVISKDHPVYLNGRRVIDGQELPRSAEIQLSGPTGPKLKLERMDDALANIPKTDILRSGQDIGDIVHAQRKGGQRLATWLAAATLLIAAVAGGVWFVNRDVQDTKGQVAQTQDQVAQANQNIAATQADVAKVAQDVAELNAKLPSMEEAVKNLGKKTDFTAIVRENKDSVYLIAVVAPNGEWLGRGTGFSVALPDGTRAIATNSHVAEMFTGIGKEDFPANAKMYAIQGKAPYTQVLIKDVMLHPGYTAFIEYLIGVFDADRSQKYRNLSVLLPGFDVALLYAADPTLIDKPLKLASRESYEAIEPGQDSLMIGYPAEDTPGTDWKMPDATTSTGIVTGNTTYFLSRGGPESNLLVQHSSGSSGGSSGSPVFNAAGEVIALNNAGSYKFIEDSKGNTIRFASNARISYAQRVDMLMDLTEGTIEARMPVYRKQWEEEVKAFVRTPEETLLTWVAMFENDVQPNPGVVHVGTLPSPMNVQNEELKAKIAIHKIKIEKTGVYLFIARSLDGREIMTNAYDAQTGAVVSLGQGGGPVSFPGSPLPRLTEGSEILIAVIDSAPPPAAEGQPAKDGEAVLEVYYGVPR